MKQRHYVGFMSRILARNPTERHGSTIILINVESAQVALSGVSMQNKIFPALFNTLFKLRARCNFSSWIPIEHRGFLHR